MALTSIWQRVKLGTLFAREDKTWGFPNAQMLPAPQCRLKIENLTRELWISFSNLSLIPWLHLRRHKSIRRPASMWLWLVGFELGDKPTPLVACWRTMCWVEFPVRWFKTLGMVIFLFLHNGLFWVLLDDLGYKRGDQLLLLPFLMISYIYQALSSIICPFQPLHLREGFFPFFVVCLWDKQWCLVVTSSLVLGITCNCAQGPMKYWKSNPFFFALSPSSHPRLQKEVF